MSVSSSWDVQLSKPTRACEIASWPPIPVADVSLYGHNLVSRGTQTVASWGVGHNVPRLATS